MAPSFTHLKKLFSKADAKLQKVKCRLHKTKAVENQSEITIQPMAAVEPKPTNKEEQGNTSEPKLTNEEEQGNASEPTCAAIRATREMRPPRPPALKQTRSKRRW